MKKSDRKIIHIGNILNNGYLNCKFLRRIGIEADSYNIDYTHVQGQPEWEEVPIVDPVKEWGQGWSTVDLKGFRRPAWFADISFNGVEYPKKCYDRLFPYFGYLIDKYRTFFPNRVPLTYEDINDFACRGLSYSNLAKGYFLCQAYGVDPIYFMLGAPSRPYVCFSHGTLRDHPYEQSARGRLYALSLKMAEKVIITNADCNRSAERLGLDNYIFIPHPVDETRYSPGDSPLRRKLMKEHGCEWIFVAPARHHWKRCPPGMETSWFKCNDILIRALGKFFASENSVNALVVFFDWGREVDDSKKLIEECGFADRVHWEPLSSKPVLEEFYRASDIVFDQFNDGIGTFGTVVPEALSCGKPVILNYKESLHHWCYPELPPLLNAVCEDDIIRHIIELVSSKEYCDELGERGRKWICDNHSSSIVANRMSDIYSEIEELSSKQCLKFQEFTTGKEQQRTKSEFCFFDGAEYSESFYEIGKDLGLIGKNNWLNCPASSLVRFRMLLRFIDFFVSKVGKLSLMGFILFLVVFPHLTTWYINVSVMLLLLVASPVIRLFLFIFACIEKRFLREAVTEMYVVFDTLQRLSLGFILKMFIINIFMKLRFISKFNQQDSVITLSPLQFAFLNLSCYFCKKLDSCFFQVASFVLPVLHLFKRREFRPKSDCVTVMHNTCSFDWGGTQRQIINLCSNSIVDDIKHVPNEIFIDSNRMFNCNKVLKVSDYSVGILCGSGFAWLLSSPHTKSLKVIQVFKLFCDFRRQKPDMVVGWGHEVALYTYFAALFAKVPHIVFCIRTVNPNFYRSANEKIFRKLHRQISSRLTAIIVNSSFLKQDYASWLDIDPNRIEVCPNGIELGRLESDDESSALKIREALGISKEDIVIINVGRFSPEKRQEMMMQAAGYINSDSKCYSNVHWVLCGDGSTRLQIEAYVNEKDIPNVHFVGAVDHVWEYLNAADIFVMPSDFEGQPNAMMEAMLSSLPCISTKYSGALDLAEDGKSAFFVDPKDPEAVADKIKVLLDDSVFRKNMGLAGKKMIQEFSNEKMIENFNKIIAGTVNMKPRKNS